jgi:hypothetical protein
MAQADQKLPGAEAHRARRLHLTVPDVARQFVVKDEEYESDWYRRFAFNDAFPPPQCLVNLKSSHFPSPNISRTALVCNYDTWDLPLRNDINKHLAETKVKEVLELSQEDRLYFFGSM